MSRTPSFITQYEMRAFHGSMHLFETNKLATDHNRHMLKCLNIPIARCNVEQTRNVAPTSSKDEQLEAIILLCPGQKVMLTSNLWIVVGLVNGSLEKIVSIFYKESLSPPQLPTFVVVNFYKYVGPHWDPNNPTYLPIPPNKKGSHT